LLIFKLDLNKLLQQKQEEIKKLVEKNNLLRQQLNQSDQRIIELNGQIKLLQELLNKQ